MGSYVDKVIGNDETALYGKGKLTAEVLSLFIGTEEAAIDLGLQLALLDIIKTYLGQRFTTTDLLVEVSWPSVLYGGLTYNKKIPIVVNVLGSFTVGFVDALAKEAFREKSAKNLNLARASYEGFKQALITAGIEATLRLVKLPARYNKQQFEDAFKRVSKAGDAVFGSARQFVRNKYGQNVLNQLAAKFGANNDGAAAVILQKWGDEGLIILNKSTVNSLDNAANELLRGKTAYRHISSDVSYLEQLKTTGKVPQNPNKTYFSLDKFDDPAVAIDKMQLNADATDAVWRLEFDANQMVGKTVFPTGKWNNSEYIEVVTRSYPDFGSGGASQFITQSEIILKRMVNLKTGQVINF